METVRVIVIGGTAEDFEPVGTIAKRRGVEPEHECCQELANPTLQWITCLMCRALLTKGLCIHESLRLTR